MNTEFSEADGGERSHDSLDLDHDQVTILGTYISFCRLNSTIIALNFSTGHFWPVVKIRLKVDSVVNIRRFLS